MGLRIEGDGCQRRRLSRKGMIAVDVGYNVLELERSPCRLVDYTTKGLLSSDFGDSGYTAMSTDT